MRPLRAILLCLLLLLLSGCRNGLLDESQPQAVESGGSGVSIVGNQAISDGDLEDAARHELRSLREQGARKADAADAAYAMEILLRERGYHDGSVEFQVAGGAATFAVREGPRALFGGVRFGGVTAFPESELTPYFDFAGEGLLGLGLVEVEDPVYDAAAVDGAVAQVETHYLLAGYVDVRVPEPEVTWNETRTLATVHVRVDEGRRYTVARVEYVGVAEQDLSMVGKPYHARVPAQASAEVRHYLRKAGHQFATVRGEGTLDSARAQAVVRIVAEPGPLVALDEVRVKGLDRTEPAFFRARIPVARGEFLREERLERGINGLFRTGLFARVSRDVVRTGPASADLELEVDELPARSVAVEAGWGSYELARGAVRFRDANVFGRNYIFDAEVEASLRSREVQTRWTDLWVLGWRSRVELGAGYAFREEPTFDREGVRLEATVLHDLAGPWSLRGGYLFELEQASNVRGIIADEDRAGFVRKAGFFGELRYDTRDDILLPSSGALAEGRLFWSSPSLGADLDYLELEVHGVGYVAWSDDTVLALGASFRTRQPLDDSATLPVQTRYFLGGEASVRSFDEDELSPLDATGTATGGLTAIEGHVELRQRFYRELHGAVFYDIGFVDPRPFRVDVEPGHALGLGLRYYLPIGPIRVDLAYGLGTRFAADSRWALHVGFGFSF